LSIKKLRYVVPPKTESSIAGKYPSDGETLFVLVKSSSADHVRPRSSVSPPYSGFALFRASPLYEHSV